MVNLCILSTDENVEMVSIKKKLPDLSGKILPYPLSSTNENPPTHWFCFM